MTIMPNPNPHCQTYANINPVVDRSCRVDSGTRRFGTRPFAETNMFSLKTKRLHRVSISPIPRGTVPPTLTLSKTALVGIAPLIT